MKQATYQTVSMITSITSHVCWLCPRPRVAWFPRFLKVESAEFPEQKRNNATERSSNSRLTSDTKGPWSVGTGQKVDPTDVAGKHLYHPGSSWKLRGKSKRFSRKKCCWDWWNHGWYPWNTNGIETRDWLQIKNLIPFGNSWKVGFMFYVKISNGRNFL